MNDENNLSVVCSGRDAVARVGRRSGTAPQGDQDREDSLRAQSWIEPGTMDVVYDEISKWSHWTLTDEHEKADLIIVLSAQRYLSGMANFGSGSATATATTYGSTTVVHGSGSAQGIAVPVIQETRYLTVVEPKSGLALLTLSCRRREINGNSRTGKILVSRLKERFPKGQR
jgi:hypothetical protein